MANEKMIITLGREHGTMGEKVADKLRKQFQMPLYDKAHLLKAVEGTEEYDELNAFFNDRKVDSLLYAIAMSESVRANDVPLGLSKELLGIQEVLLWMVVEIICSVIVQTQSGFFACQQRYQD